MLVILLLLACVQGDDDPRFVLHDSKISLTKGRFQDPLADPLLESEDEFGAALASLGDLDGDGVNDLAIGAPGDDDGGDARGAVWIVFLHADGNVKTRQKIAQGHGGLLGTLPAGGRFGTALAGIGDLNGDGTSELAVGCPGLGSARGRGGVIVLFLSRSGKVLRQRELGPGDPDFAGLLFPDHVFGSSITTLGDYDEDGIREIAVSAVTEDLDQAPRGEIWVLGLFADGSMMTQAVLAPGLGGLPSGGTFYEDNWGRCISWAGDLDGTGVDKLVVGEPSWDSGFPANHGSYHRYRLLADDELAGGGASSDYTQYDSQEIREGWSCVAFPSGLIAVGAPGAEVPFDGPQKGAVIIHDYDTPFVGKFSIFLNDFQLEGVVDTHDRFGAALADLRDLNGDGVEDIAVGATGDDDGATDVGAVWVVQMHDGSSPAWVIRNGRGVNPYVLETRGPSHAASPWRFQIQAQSPSLLAIGPEALMPSIDLDSSVRGELLLAPPYTFRFSSAGSFAFPIPPVLEFALVGRVQGARLSNGGWELTNAIDLYVGP